MQRADVSEVAEQAVDLQAEIPRRVIAEAESIVEVVVDVARIVEQCVTPLRVDVPHVDFVRGVRTAAGSGQRQRERGAGKQHRALGSQHGGPLLGSSRLEITGGMGSTATGFDWTLVRARPL